MPIKRKPHVEHDPLPQEAHGVPPSGGSFLHFGIAPFTSIPPEGGIPCASSVWRAVRAERAVYAALLAVTAGWLGAILLAPLLAARGAVTAALTIYQAFSVICHQMPERAFHLHGLPLGVCSRCTGIYAGFAVGLLIYPLVRDLREERFPPRWMLLGAALPMTVDFALGWLRLIDNTFLSRTLTGALFGAVAAFYVLPGLVATFCERDAAHIPATDPPISPLQHQQPQLLNEGREQ